MTKLTAAPQNNRFHGVGASAPKNSQRERGERIESRGNGTAALYINGKFIAILPEEEN